MQSIHDTSLSLSTRNETLKCTAEVTSSICRINKKLVLLRQFVRGLLRCAWQPNHSSHSSVADSVGPTCVQTPPAYSSPRKTGIRGMVRARIYMYVQVDVDHLEKEEKSLMRLGYCLTNLAHSAQWFAHRVCHFPSSIYTLDCYTALSLTKHSRLNNQ